MRFFTLLIIAVCTLLSLVCESPYKNNNPYDPDYEGQYSFNVDTATLPETLCLFRPYIVSYSIGVDSFKSIYLDPKTKGKVDTSIFLGRDEFTLLFKDTMSDTITISAIPPNHYDSTDRIWRVKRKITVVNPFKISVSNAVFLEQMSLSLARTGNWSTSFKPDSADSVIWQIGKALDTLPYYKAKNFTLSDSSIYAIKAIFWDHLGNQAAIGAVSVAPYVDRPVVNVASSFNVRVGTVKIPVSFKDSLSTVDSIFYRIGQGSDVGMRTLAAASDTIELLQPIAGTYSLSIWAVNKKHLRSTAATANLTTFIPDLVKPTLQLLDDLDSSVIATPEQTIRILAKDNFGVTSVYAQTSVHKHEAQQVNGDTFSVKITDIPEKEYFPVTVFAVDSFSNKDSILFDLFYDHTALDQIPPKIEQISGSIDGSRVECDTGRLVFKVEDDNGMDSVFYKLNGIFVGLLTLASTNTYALNYSLPSYGENEIVVYATDKSINRNSAVKNIKINHNTRPDMVSNIQPTIGATGVDNTSGVSASWKAVIDKDGDPVSYQVFWGQNTSNLAMKVVNTPSCNLTGIGNNQKCFWYVNTISGEDTVRYPSVKTSFLSFTTADVEAPTIVQVGGAVNGTRIIDGTGTLTFTIKDTNGLDSAYFMVNGVYKGNALKVEGDTFEINYNFSAFELYAVKVVAIDASSKHNLATKTITLNYSNLKPTISNLPRTLNVQYGETISLDPIISDDGKSVSRQWIIEKNAIASITGDTSISILKGDLPRKDTIYFRATDDDNNTSEDTIIIGTDITIESLGPNPHGTPFYWKGSFYAYEPTSLNKSNDLRVWESVGATTFYLPVQMGMNQANTLYAFNMEKALIRVSPDGLKWDTLKPSSKTPPMTAPNTHTSRVVCLKRGVRNEEAFAVFGGYEEYIGMYKGPIDSLMVSTNGAQSWGTKDGLKKIEALFGTLPLLHISDSVPNTKDTIFFVDGRDNKRFRKIHFNEMQQYNNYVSWGIDAEYPIDNGNFNCGALERNKDGDFWLFSNANIQRSTDGGATWKVIKSVVPWSNENYMDVKMKDGNVYIITRNGCWVITNKRIAAGRP
jgi:hypothetical protein